MKYDVEVRIKGNPFEYVYNIVAPSYMDARMMVVSINRSINTTAKILNDDPAAELESVMEEFDKIISGEEDVRHEDFKLESNRVIINIDSKIKIHNDGFTVEGDNTRVDIDTVVPIEEDREYGVIVYRI